jgi:hypothetical protein
MQISSAILTFALIQSANAFFVQPNAVKKSHHVLASTPQGFNVGQGVGSSPNDQGTGAALKTTGKMDGRTQGSKTSDAIIVQGGSLRTWSFATPLIERVQVVLTTVDVP